MEDTPLQEMLIYIQCSVCCVKERANVSDRVMSFLSPALGVQNLDKCVPLEFLTDWGGGEGVGIWDRMISASDWRRVCVRVERGVSTGNI
jgi:hypothetical protein